MPRSDSPEIDLRGAQIESVR